MNLFKIPTKASNCGAWCASLCVSDETAESAFSSPKLSFICEWFQKARVSPHWWHTHTHEETRKRKSKTFDNAPMQKRTHTAHASRVYSRDDDQRWESVSLNALIKCNRTESRRPSTCSAALSNLKKRRKGKTRERLIYQLVHSIHNQTNKTDR